MTGQDMTSSHEGLSSTRGARLVDTAAPGGVATTPAEVAARVETDTFFWLDLEDLSDDEVREYGESLRLSAETIEKRLTVLRGHGSVRRRIPWWQCFRGWRTAIRWLPRMPTTSGSFAQISS
jgi:hypothetical protein